MDLPASRHLGRQSHKATHQHRSDYCITLGNDLPLPALWHPHMTFLIAWLHSTGSPLSLASQIPTAVVMGCGLCAVVLELPALQACFLDFEQVR